MRSTDATRWYRQCNWRGGEIRETNADAGRMGERVACSAQGHHGVFTATSGGDPSQAEPARCPASGQESKSSGAENEPGLGARLAGHASCRHCSDSFASSPRRRDHATRSQPRRYLLDLGIHQVHVGLCTLSSVRERAVREMMSLISCEEERSKFHPCSLLMVAHSQRPW